MIISLMIFISSFVYGKYIKYAVWFMRHWESRAFATIVRVNTDDLGK